MARRTQTLPPLCAKCGYDRTGLPMGEVPALCPECGSREVDTPWPGLRAVLFLGTGLPLTLGALGCALPVVISGVLYPAGEPALVVVWMLLGFFGTISYTLLMPIAASSAHGREIWTKRGRAGQVRILLVCWGVSGAGLAAIAVVAGAVVEVARALA